MGPATTRESYEILQLKTLRRHPIWNWKSALGFLAALQITGGLLGFFLATSWTEAATPTPYPLWIYFLNIAAFGTAAALLLYGSRSDRRASSLGLTYLLAASAFSHRPLLRLAELLPGWVADFTVFLERLPATVFIPFFMWRFFHEFPRGAPSARANRVNRVALRVSLLVGLVLFAGDTVLASAVLIGHPGDADSLLLSATRRLSQMSWLLIYSLFLPALAFAVWRAKRADPEESRRVGIFVGGLALGCGPVVVEGLLEMFVPAFRELMNDHSSQIIAGIIVYPLLLSVPVTTAYSVLVDRVLDVKLVLRKALRYALARYTVMLSTALPFMGLTVYIYFHRDEPVHRLFSGPGPLFLLGLGLAGLVATRLRRRVLTFLDRRFFREAYDSQAILARLVDRSRGAATVEELRELLTEEIDRALHLTEATVFTINKATGYLVSPDRRFRPLSVASPLATLLAGDADVLDVTDDPQSPLRRLPLADRQWIADGGFRLLAPLLGSDGVLLGTFALGEKRSELSFSRDDRILLTTLAASGALALENRLARIVTTGGGAAVSPPGVTAQVDGRAMDSSDLAELCLDCSRLQQPASSTCEKCGGRLVAAPVPYILRDKFRLETRVGSGGMGVVYSAVDLTLGRTVAIKTLPRMSPEYSLRLRREARVMASVQHPNLAMIFGAETWRGTPMLVFEYLEGGTLLDRIQNERFGFDEAVGLGMTMLDVLERIHSAGVLHRDIKPSNIGYTKEGTPKLLDFGLAHIVYDSCRRGAMTEKSVGVSDSFADDGVDPTSTTQMTWARNFVGTPAYMCPEALLGEMPQSCFDLWSLGIVLFESLTGTNPVLGDGVKGTLAKIAEADIPDIRDLRRDCPESMAWFFRVVLSKNRARRPRNTREMRAQLERARRRLSPGS